jgi:hypothetical protein
MAYTRTEQAVDRRIRFAISQLDRALRRLELPTLDPDQRNKVVVDVVRDFAIAINSLGQATEKITRWGFTR